MIRRTPVEVKRESIDNINTLATLLPHAYAPVPRPSRPQRRTPPPPAGAAGTASGTAAERFARMVAALGGPKVCLSIPIVTCRPRRSSAVTPARAGHVTAVDCRALGLLVVRQF